MDKIEFDQVKEELTTFWWLGKEHFWYKKAWEILDDSGLTSYDNEFECVDVFLRAIALSMIYSDFCKLAFDQFDYYDGYHYHYEDYLEDIVIGQMFGRLKGEELTYDRHYIVCRLADNKRDEVFSALKTKLDEFEIFLGMYFTAVTPYNASMASYDEYWDVILNNPSEIADDTVSADGFFFEAEGAYTWIVEGVYCIQEI